MNTALFELSLIARILHGPNRNFIYDKMESAANLFTEDPTFRKNLLCFVESLQTAHETSTLLS